MYIRSSLQRPAFASPLGCYGAPVWVPWAKGKPHWTLFYMRWRLCLQAAPSTPLTLSLLPTPTVLHVCLDCSSENRFIGTVFLGSIYIRVHIQCLSFSFSLLFLGSSFIHLIRTDSDSPFLLLSSVPLRVRTTTSLSIHLWVDHYLLLFWFLFRFHINSYLKLMTQNVKSLMLVP